MTATTDNTTETESGKWATSGNTLTLTDSDGEKEVMTYSISGNTLTLTMTLTVGGETTKIVQTWTRK